jgi:hypothetical protein
MYSNLYVLYVKVEWLLAGLGWNCRKYSVYLLMVNKHARNTYRLIDEINYG